MSACHRWDGGQWQQFRTLLAGAIQWISSPDGEVTSRLLVQALYAKRSSCAEFSFLRTARRR
ncbi:hypothetical protein [Paenibacillus oleatilyticus]|uniref:hypothetical protein n=1 Tax=Paenibacillus oleatilyticus TaxID=2594886 RepID=UPI001C1FC43E|nr:hypothetical protein [Paenibacillus oleatilyticus]MBU7314114.1 hypothetical protein [Paenibacillus oleatilyticus]